MKIRTRADCGLGIREISRQTGLSRVTVRKYLRADRDEEIVWGPRAPRPTLLDPYKGYLLERLKHEEPGKRIPNTVYLREMKALGYPGGETQLRRWLKEQREVKVEATPLIRFETPPGEQVQIDWAVIRRGKDSLSAFIATLGHSRWSYVWFTTNEKVETLIDCHERLFEALGGVPKRGLYDNPKTIVVQRNAYGKGKHQYNPAFLAFARHCGFFPQLCKPYRAQTKGKVERFIRYMRESFLWPLESKLKAEGRTLDVDTANAEVGPWLRTVANARVHRETKKVPLEALSADLMALQPYPGPMRAVPALETPRRLMELKNGQSSAGWPQPARTSLNGGLVVPQHDLSVYEEVRV